MATADFVNNFPAAVAVTIGEPMNTIFTVGSRSTVKHSIRPGSYTVTFSKNGNENVTINGLLLADNSVVDIAALWTAGAANKTHSVTLASSGVVPSQAKCLIVNDTLNVGTISLAVGNPSLIPVLGVPVGQTLELHFAAEAKRSFTAEVNGRRALVHMKDFNTTLYLSSVFPKPLNATVQYFVYGANDEGKPIVPQHKPQAYTYDLPKAFDTSLSLESYV